MFVSRVIQGRLLNSDDIELIRGLIATHPNWSRYRLSIAVSEQFNWRSANGQLKDMSARLLLAKLAESGLIELPPRQRRGPVAYGVRLADLAEIAPGPPPQVATRRVAEKDETLLQPLTKGVAYGRRALPKQS